MKSRALKVFRRGTVAFAVVVLAFGGMASCNSAFASMWLTAFPENDLAMLDARVEFNLSAALAFFAAAIGLAAAGVLRMKGIRQMSWIESLHIKLPKSSQSDS